MINLHNKLWVCIASDRKVEDANYKLAYMTHAEYDEDGEPKANFSKRMETGLSWTRKCIEKHFDFDNIPTTGFSVVGSASRWSTDNKVIRIEDPRGFVVEIPVSALTTLLKYTTVVNGVVQEECVWGKEGSSHVLIPVNSDVYQKAQLQTKQHNSKVKLNKLTEGDIVKFKPDGDDFCYVGRYKVVWNIQTKQATERFNNYSWSSRWVPKYTDVIISSEIVEETKYLYLFKCLDDNYGVNKGSGEVIITGKVDVLPEFTITDFGLYPKESLFGGEGRNRWGQFYKVANVIDLVRKEKKERV